MYRSVGKSLKTLPVEKADVCNLPAVSSPNCKNFLDLRRRAGSGIFSLALAASDKTGRSHCFLYRKRHILESSTMAER